MAPFSRQVLMASRLWQERVNRWFVTAFRLQLNDPQADRRPELREQDVRPAYAAANSVIRFLRRL
jgi:hypothetical protein